MIDIECTEVEEGKIGLDDSPESAYRGSIKLPSPSIGALKAQFRKFSVEESPEYLKAKPNVRPVLKEVGANDTESSAKGYLYFKTKKGWKKQWFVIKDKVLYRYKASEVSLSVHLCAIQRKLPLIIIGFNFYFWGQGCCCLE